MLNLVIITSVIKTIDKKLSYTNTRSIFSHEERYIQTLNTIDSIKKYYDDRYIILIEGSIIPIEWENELKKRVNYYFNISENEIIKKNIDSEIKGLGEVTLLYSYFLSEHFRSIREIVDNIMKISGRYYFNNNSININKLFLNSNDKIICNIDYKNDTMSTVCYILDKTELDEYLNMLEKSFENPYFTNGILILEYYFLKFWIKNKKINNITFGVSGNCAVDNYFICM
jgi:hypothetical protein